ncbi:MAG: PQQ-binding-like beta-propeller repeat protein [Deltaproteobacteria bacterium]|nr:PQQ-binding-like beta-propeller repeat protein [Deltaproteobacteria bacterium]
MRRVILPVCALALAAASCPGAPSKLTDWGLPFHYAQTGWVTIHRDARNSDFAPYVSTTPNEISWTALDGAATVTAPAQGPEGNLYVTTGQGPGTSHLHAFGRDGNLLWESAPHVGADDLDVGAIGSSPIIDRQGDIYLSDGNQFWAFHPDGSVKWVTDTEALGAGGTMVTAIFTLQGYVGGIPTNGKVMLFHRSDGSLAVPVFDLPGGDGPPSEPAPGGVWEGGYVDPKHIQTLWEGFLSAEREVANTPAVHPETGRIYITAAAATAGDGVLYGLDIVGGQIQIAFEGPMGGGSGTSPAISPDGAQVYAADGNGIMTAFDATTGVVLWQAAGAGAAASPAVGPDGTIYSGDNLGGLTTALVPADGSVKWSQNYDALADVYLDPVAPSGLIPTGLPVARPNSVISVSACRTLRFSAPSTGTP